MLITSIQELRLASPTHALDSIDGLVGFIDNSEHDFLEDKLGTPLYNALCEWYERNQYTRSSVADYQTGYWNRLLLMAQRVVAFDALGRSAGMQGVSVNNAGINQMVADDYPKADDKAIATYRETCTKEAHAALNQLLRKLEQWCKEGVIDGSPADDTSALSPHPSDIEDSERSEIVNLWKKSRYYYLAAALLIPSCEVLQSYLDIYDSREKFIQMLPDLQFIQEEIIGNSIGDDLLKAVIDFARDGKVPVFPANDGEDPKKVGVATMQRLVHRLRKVMVALLVGRTSVKKYTKEQKVQAHDDGVRMLQSVVEYLRQHQDDFPPELIENSDWYIKKEDAGCEKEDVCNCDHQPSDVCHHPSRGAACWTPPLL